MHSLPFQQTATRLTPPFSLSSRQFVHRGGWHCV